MDVNTAIHAEKETTAPHSDTTTWCGPSTQPDDLRDLDLELSAEILNVEWSGLDELLTDHAELENLDPDLPSNQFNIEFSGPDELRKDTPGLSQSDLGAGSPSDLSGEGSLTLAFVSDVDPSQTVDGFNDMYLTDSELALFDAYVSFAEAVGSYSTRTETPEQTALVGSGPFISPSISPGLMNPLSSLTPSSHYSTALVHTSPTVQHQIPRNTLLVPTLVRDEMLDGPFQLASSQSGQLRTLAPNGPLPKRPRTQSPANPDCTHVFAVNPRSSDGHVTTPRKRQKRSTYSQKTCLRCQSQKLKCSGTFPCSNCSKHWKTMQSRMKAIVNWKECFDSKIEELNAFETIWEFINPHDFNIKVTTDDARKIWTTRSEHPKNYLLSVAKAATNLWVITTNTAVNAGLADHILERSLGLKDTLLVVEGHSRDITPEAPLSLLFSNSIVPDPYRLYWIFAAIHVHPEYIAQQTGLSDLHIWAFSQWISSHMFRCMAWFITKVKASNTRLDTRVNLFVILSTALCVVHSEAFHSHLQNSLLPYLVNRAALLKAQVLTTPQNHVRDKLLKLDAWRARVRAQIAHFDEYFSYMAKNIINNHDEYKRTKIVTFYVGVLCRLDMTQKIQEAQHPVDQAIKICTQIGMEKAHVDKMNKIQRSQVLQKDKSIKQWWDFAFLD